MRTSAVHGPLRVQAIAGTYVVLMGIDFDRAKLTGVHGFGVERLDHTEGEHRWLTNNLRFDEVKNSPDPKIARQWGTDYNPLQTFMWGDYTAKPSHEYTYIVHALTGTPGKKLTSKAEVMVRVRTEQPAQQGVFFNRGVISSQAYAQRFKNAKPKDVANFEAYRWLSRGLQEALLAFIGQAVDNHWDLNGSFYEFEHASILNAFAVARDAGARVHLIVDGGQYKVKNSAAVATAGIEGLVERWRENATIPHNKFLVASRDGQPVALWTGSTNISENGIFGQTNVGHSHRDPALAARYLAYWNELLGDPTRDPLRAWVEANNPLPAEWPVGTSVVFSPHTHFDPLDRFAKLFGGGTTLVCGTFPFNLDSRFGKLLPGPHDAMRYLLFEDPKQAEKAAAVVTDAKTVLVAGAFLPTGGLKGWAGELKNPFSNNVEYVHSKFILIDPLGEDPVVITGSANFSTNSTNMNDENVLVIRGDKEVADIYLTEFLRLFEHYKFRYFLKLSPQALTPGPQTGVDAKQPLDTGNDWSAKYYDDPGRARQRVVMSGGA